jgi:hypothetical protein
MMFGIDTSFKIVTQSLFLKIIFLLFITANFAASGNKNLNDEHSQILIAETSRLPIGTNPGDACDLEIDSPKSIGGKLIQENKWVVLWEETMGKYDFVSFAGKFEKWTSGACLISKGNIGIFEENILKFIIYTKSEDDTLIGELEYLENHNIRIWSGSVVPYPVADLRIKEQNIKIDPVASSQTFCNKEETMPNIYGMKISNARKLLLKNGWTPSIADKLWGFREKEFKKSGIIEVHDCSGTGFARCFFSYNGNIASLQVITKGEDNDPRVAETEVECPA